RVAREWIELQALKYTNYRSLTTLTETGIPGPEGSASKLVCSAANQRPTRPALEIRGSGEADGYRQYQPLRVRATPLEHATRDSDGVRLRLRARAVREEDRHLPGDLALGRRRVRRRRARAVARVLGGVVRGRGRRADGARVRGGEVAGDRGRGARVREVDPGA